MTTAAMSTTMPDEIGRGPLEPEIIPPVQFRPRSIATPEKRLLLAVLEEAVGTFQRHVAATDRHSRAVFSDVEAWFASEDTARLCSFVGICDVLGIDAMYVRSGLGRWTGTAQAVYRFPFRRMNGTRHRTTGQPQGRRNR